MLLTVSPTDVKQCYSPVARLTLFSELSCSPTDVIHYVLLIGSLTDVRHSVLLTGSQNDIIVFFTVLLTGNPSDVVQCYSPEAYLTSFSVTHRWTN